MTDSAIAFFREHAGYSYDPKRETAEEGRERCARDLASAEGAFRADPDVFIVWELDDIGSESNYPFYCALLCVDCDYPSADLVRGYDSRDGIFERPGKVVASLGGIDFGPDEGPSTADYARVIAAELYQEFQATREAVLVRGDN